MSLFKDLLRDKNDLYVALENNINRINAAIDSTKYKFEVEYDSCNGDF